jgi:hypothetical protein
VGGTFSALEGGKFGSGFLSAGVSDLASPYIMENSKGDVALGTAESAVLGGTTSVIGGGKFGNGAVTGAFGYLFNQVYHKGMTNAQECKGDLACEKAVFQAAYNKANSDNWWLAIPALAPAVVVGAIEIGGGVVGDFLFGGSEDASASTGAYSTRDTSGGLKGVNTNVSASDFAANLEANGYTATTTNGTNGPVTILQNGQGSTYTIYTRSSTGVSGAQYIGPNGQIVKFNLGK